MKKIIKKMIPIGIISPLFFTISNSCDVRQANLKDIYIKNYNESNFVQNNYLINKIGYPTNDFEILLHSPLIKWTFQHKSKYDSLNKVFFKNSVKFLTFNLAERIQLIIEKPNSDNFESYDFYKDEVDQSSVDQNTNNGIVRIYANDNENINSLFFEETLKKATKIRLFIRNTNESLDYVNFNNQKTGASVIAKDYWNSISQASNYQQYFEKNLIEIPTLENLLNLGDNYSLTFSQKPEYWDKGMQKFVLKELTNNLIFNPLSSAGLDKYGSDFATKLENTYFIGNYIVAESSPTQLRFTKNFHYWNLTFRKLLTKLRDIVLNFNPVEIDIESFRFQQFKAFKQNLVSEVDYDILNSSQKEEVNLKNVAFGLTFNTSFLSNFNTNKYFYDLDYLKSKTNFSLFEKIFFGIDNSFEFENFFNSEAFELRNLLNVILNPYSYVQLLDKNNYWNSYTPQNLEINQIKIVDLKDTINNQLLYFNNSLNQISFYENKKSFSSNLLNNSDALKNIKYQEIKIRIKELLDEYYERHNIDLNTKIEWIIPIYSQKTWLSEKNYQRLIELINALDSRLNPKYQFVNKQTKTYLQYLTIDNFDNSFGEYVINLFKNSSLHLSALINSFENNFQTNKNFKLLFDNFVILKETLFNYFSIQNWQEFNSLIKNSFDLNSNNELKSKLNNLSIDTQMNFIKLIDLILNTGFNETQILIQNDYNKQLVQYFYDKPLSDEGLVYFQDINVY
ncbi:OppA family ABC transporter substrate-binding lipoprotein [Mycoplasmopsis gallinarum]|uniref:OppA family ABC transporter substrate-binding lipoprotein n=1 Tax=Mycoplasmopsis gallinarum TaxID=29557 RepID=UPI0004863A75|nr:hypothetical protein [Mycoplasmopsis gallinarum]